MSGLAGGRLGLIVLSVVSLAIVAAVALQLRDRTRIYEITLAAGSPSGESYLLSEALKTVLRRHHANIELTIRQTGGTAESLALLESGRVTMAAAQADVPV